MPLEQLMALIFVLALQLQPRPTIITTKVASPRMSLLPQPSTCIFATSSVAGREVHLNGESFMMHGFMTLWSQKASFTLQMQAIHSDVLLVPFHGVQYHLLEWEACGLWYVIYQDILPSLCS